VVEDREQHTNKTLKVTNLLLSKLADAAANNTNQMTSLKLEEEEASPTEHAVKAEEEAEK